MSTIEALNASPSLAAVRLVATTNQSGTYSNGFLNNGVGATFTYATGALTIDSVAVNLNDYILFSGQTSAFQNGIWQCTQVGATGVSAILQRRGDFQCIEQIKTGHYTSVKAGAVYAGSMAIIVEPLPSAIGNPVVSGANNINFNVIPAAVTTSGTTGYPTIVTNIVVGQAALATGGAVTLLPSSGSHQYQILDLKLNKTGTNFSGGGGDRLGQVTDGTNVFTVIPATNMQTLLNSAWGDSTPVPAPVTASYSTLTVAGAPVTFKYSGGTADYTAGSLTMTVVAVLVA